MKTCIKCGEEFELRLGKPGYANVCEDCTGLRPVTRLAKPEVSKSPVTLRTATINVIRAFEALNGKPDPVLRALVQPLLDFRVSPRKSGAR
jgi:hypothetical protein